MSKLRSHLAKRVFLQKASQIFNSPEAASISRNNFLGNLEKKKFPMCRFWKKYFYRLKDNSYILIF